MGRRRLRHDGVDDAVLEEVSGSHTLQGRHLTRSARVAVHDRTGSLGWQRRQPCVLGGYDTTPGQQRERTPATPLAQEDRHRRHGQLGHVGEAPGDLGGQRTLLGVGRQIGARGVLTMTAARNLLAALVRRQPVRVKVAARRGEIGLMSGDDSSEGVLQLLEASGLTEEEYRGDVPARIGLAIPFDRPGRRAKDVTQPALFCVCHGDTVAPAPATLRHAARAPRGQVRGYDAGHFDIYLGDDFERVVTDQIAFLRQHVPSRLPGSIHQDDNSSETPGLHVAGY